MTSIAIKLPNRPLATRQRSPRTVRLRGGRRAGDCAARGRERELRLDLFAGWRCG